MDVKVRLIAVASSLLVLSTAAQVPSAQGAMLPSADAAPRDQPVGTNRLVSGKVDGSAPERRWSTVSSVDGTGEYVGFRSRTPGLVVGAGSPRKNEHLYLRNMDTGAVTLVDARPDGHFSNGTVRDYDGSSPSVSADGRVIAFSSMATNLAPVGYTLFSDVFVRDMAAGVTTLVSVGADGTYANSYSHEPKVSADGGTIVFTSGATNIVPLEPGNPHWDNVYRYDVASGTTTLVSKTPSGGYPLDGGAFAPSVSADGATIVYYTGSKNIVPPYTSYPVVVLYDVTADTSTMVSLGLDGPANGYSGPAIISGDGSTVLFLSEASNLVPDDVNGFTDLFSYDVATGEVSLVSRSHTGGPTDGGTWDMATDNDASHIAFSSRATNIVDDGGGPEIDVFLYDRDAGTTTLVSRDADGAPANGPLSFGVSMSGDGSLVTYQSEATNIVPGTRRPEVRRVYAYRVY